MVQYAADGFDDNPDIHVLLGVRVKPNLTKTLIGDSARLLEWIDCPQLQPFAIRCFSETSAGSSVSTWGSAPPVCFTTCCFGKLYAGAITFRNERERSRASQSRAIVDRSTVTLFSPRSVRKRTFRGSATSGPSMCSHGWASSQALNVGDVAPTSQSINVI